jgi:hypothetical protein
MLTLTAKDLRREATQAARTVGVGGAAAAVGTIAGRAIGSSSRSTFIPLAVSAGGAFMAIKGKGDLLRYGGVGLCLGGIWSLFDGRG